jgi:hypothetical protein
LDTDVAGLSTLPAGEGRAWYGRPAIFRPREMLEKFKGRFAVVANAKENAEFTFWIGSGISDMLLGWRITCQLCGEFLNDKDAREVDSPFCQYREAALRGERLLDAEGERGTRTWASPVDILRLLLMRRIPRAVPDEDEFWRFRVLGAIVPEFDELLASQRENLSASGSPILPLHLRWALLAGVAIVDRAGPAMMRMLQGHTMGENRARFGKLAERSIAHAHRPRAFLQWQLI